MADQLPTLTEEEMKALGWTPAPAAGIPTLSASEIKALGVPDKDSKFKTGILHGAQGATGGFSDEATGVVAGAIESTGPGRWIGEHVLPKLGIAGLERDAQGNLRGGTGDVIENADGSVPSSDPTLTGLVTGQQPESAFNRARKGGTQAAREVNAKSAHDNEGVAAVSDTVASILSPINKIGAGVKAGQGVLAGVKAATKAGAVQGGISGLGYSEADDVIGMGRDVAIGAGFGAGFGAAGSAAMGAGIAAKNAYKLRKLRGDAPQSVAPQAAPEAATAPDFAETFLPPTAKDPVLSARSAPESATVAERPAPKTEIGAKADPTNFHEFKKGRIMEAMRRNGNNAAKAMMDLGIQWKALVKGKASAPTRAEGATVLDPVLSLDSEIGMGNDAARTIINGPARRSVDPYGATQVDALAGTMALPQPGLKPASPKGPSTKEVQSAARAKKDSELLDADFTKKIEKDKEALSEMIHAEVIEGPQGLKATPTQQKRLDRASEAVVDEVVSNPDVRDAYLGKAKKGRKVIQGIVGTVKEKNDALYENFTKKGRDVVDVNDYAAKLEKAAQKANSAGRIDDVKLIDFINDRFKAMNEKNGGKPVTLQQLRGFTTTIQAEAASALGGLNAHHPNVIKQRTSGIVTGLMYETVKNAAGSDKALQTAAEAIGKNNYRIHGLKSIDDALQGREWKEQGAKSLTRRAAEVGVNAGLGAGAAALLGQNPLGGAALGAGVGVPRPGAALGRKLQKDATKKAIDAVRRADIGREGLEQMAEAKKGRQLATAGTAGLRNAGRPEAQDLTILTDAELNAEFDEASKDSLDRGRVSRIEAEFARRAGQ
jgi:hypothetical protein